MARYDDTHRAVTRDGREVKIGDNVTDFRGRERTFKGITRVPGDGSSTNGKILLDDYEYYPSVCDLTVEPRPRVHAVYGLVGQVVTLAGTDGHNTPMTITGRVGEPRPAAESYGHGAVWVRMFTENGEGRALLLDAGTGPVIPVPRINSGVRHQFTPSRPDSPFCIAPCHTHESEPVHQVPEEPSH